MYSVYARSRMMARGWSISAFPLFFVDSARDSARQVRANPGLARALVRFSTVFNTALLVALFPVYGAGLPHLYLRLLAYTGLSWVGFTAWLVSNVGLVRDEAGRMLERPGLANYFTIARFYLIVPMVVLFSHGFRAETLVVYVVLGSTDVFDGMIARHRHQRTEFGVVMDPLADVFSTAAVFAMFLAHHVIPGWLFSILMVRYGLLIVGSFILFLATGPIKFRATVPGKIVGVFQAIGAIIIVWCLWRGAGWQETVGPVLFPLLGLFFATIIVSQLIIGYRHCRRYARLRRKAV